MPLYEYFCDTCRSSFEKLISFSANDAVVQVCPRCGEHARRILSAANFSGEWRTSISPEGQTRDGQPDVTRMTLPPAARLCWMDNHSAARLAAYKAGRGAEYDDTVAARKELALRRGEDIATDAASVEHSHSPLSDTVVLTHRREAAQKEKLAESAAITGGANAKEV
jgi:putative FmdB family regulatory protein